MQTIDSVTIRNGRPSDHEQVLAVMPSWWGGRDLTSFLPKVFFIHFSNSIFIAEIDNNLIGIVVGFLSQSEENVGYIHFVGVHPEYRKVGLGHRLYQEFFDVCKTNHRAIVRSCTSPVNKLSIDFHRQMGFTVEPGDAMVDGIPVTMSYLRKDVPKVLFVKDLSKK